MVKERKGDCGPAVPAASVGVVDGVKLEKTALWGCISTFLERQSPIIFAVGTEASPATMKTALLLGLDLQVALIRQHQASIELIFP